AADVSWRLRAPARSAFVDQWRGPTSIDIADGYGDFSVRRRDGLPGFHIVTLAADTDADISHIVRGEDLLDTTGLQCALATTVGNPHFAQMIWMHHPLVLGPTGEKLSKSDLAASYQELAPSLPPEAVFRWVSRSSGG